MKLRYQTELEVAEDLKIQSSNLTGFYQAMYDFSQDLKMGSQGENRYPYFNSMHGTCTNLFRYLKEHRFLPAQIEECIWEMRNQHAQHAKKTGLIASAPFNIPEREGDNWTNMSYVNEVATKTLYENEYRLRWIKDHANLKKRG